MSIKRRLVEMIREGAVIQTQHDNAKPIAKILSAVRWRLEPTKTLIWASLFPDHQGTIHGTEYDDVKEENEGRDIGFFKDGKRVAGVVPYLESPLNADDVLEQLNEWREYVRNSDSREEFGQFTKL